METPTPFRDYTGENYMCPVSVQDCIEAFIWSHTPLSILSYQHQEGQGVSPFVFQFTEKTGDYIQVSKKNIEKCAKNPQNPWGLCYV